MNKIDELLAEKEQIRVKLAGDEEMSAEDIDAAEKRVKEIDAKIAELKKSAEDAKAKRAKLVAGLEEDYQRGELKPVESLNGSVMKFNGSIKETTDLSRDGEAYERAWVKDMASRCGVKLVDGMEMTDAEKRAFTATTANTPQVLPTALDTQIWSLIDSGNALYGDLNIDSMKNVYEIIRHKSIDAGDAAKTTENVAAGDEQNTFDTITVTGEEFKKTVKISRKASVQSVQGFESYLAREVSNRIGNSLDVYAFSQLADTTLGMDSANLALTPATAGKLTEADMRKVLAALKVDADGYARSKGRAIYASSTTIWDYVAGVQYTDGRPAFIADTMNSDPLTQGRIFGTPVKEDANVADGVLIVGYPGAIAANLFDGLDITPFIDPFTQEHSFTGYALFDCGLIVPKAFAKLTIGSAA